MEKSIVNPPALAKPVGYSHGILTQGGKILFLAGQTGMDATGAIVAPDDVVAQFRLALTNLHAVVTDAGAQMTDIVKLNIFVVNKKAYQAHAREIGQVYREFFGKYYPTMTLVEVKSLYDDNALLEIEGIAAVNSKV
ncbi:MAG: putative aminoacrylate peracid reductase RutC [Anaerolineae bacterium]|nr:putative aminoacrylate peracid reductase RutC [Anaerolineae bacterium]